LAGNENEKGGEGAEWFGIHLDESYHGRRRGSIHPLGLIDRNETVALAFPLPSDMKSKKHQPPSRQPEVVAGRGMRAWVMVGVMGALVIGAGAWLMRPQAKHMVVPLEMAAVVEPKAFEMVPEAVVHAQYGGSESCKSCHEAEYTKWKTSNHGMAERKPNAEMEDPGFVPERSFKHGTQTTELRKVGDAFEVVSLGFGGEKAPYKVERIIGHDPLRQVLVDGGNGRLQAMEACFDPKMREWFDVYGDEDRKPGEWGHWTGRGMVWNQMCASCHNTRVRKNYDEATDSYRTSMAEQSVSCESCHGPMKEHSDWQKLYPGKKGEDPHLVKWDRNQHTENCAGCHARRGEITGDFKPGDSFWDHYLLTITDQSDTYFPDGQVRDENFEFASFMSSGMQHSGVRCMDCHDMHSGKTILPGNQLCMRCHTAGGFPNAPPIVAAAHTFHGVESTGSQCINCHMPQTPYMQRHWRHDHGWTIPDPKLTKDFGVPNACNRCHQDQTTEWALAATEKWYGVRMERPMRHRAQLIAKARQGDVSAMTGLVEVLRTDRIPHWRASAALLLDQWAAEPSVRAALLEQATHEHPLVRNSVIRSLEQVMASGDAETKAVMEKALLDPVRSVRVAAAWALRETLDLNGVAGKDLLHMLHLNSDQPSGQMQLGQFHFSRGEATKAIGHMETAVKWDPNSPPFHHDLALIHSSQGNTAKAIQKLEDAIKLAPNEAQYRYEVGLAYSETGDLGKTVAALNEAVRLAPKFARAWYNLGLALNGMKRADEALVALGKGEAAEPNDPGIPYARATILAQMGRRMEAIMAVDRALEIAPGYGQAQQLREVLKRR
jgi:tetratricopeptide (TPR) repeat protein